MSSRTIAQRLLAVAIKGFGEEEVCRRLESRKLTVNTWLDGVVKMPDGKLLELIEMLDSSVHPKRKAG